MRLIRVCGSVWFALSVAFFLLPAFGQEEKDQDRLWGDLVRQYNNPQEKIFDEWNVVNEVTLVKTAKGIPSGHAALAGVLTHLEESNSLDLSRFSRGDARVLSTIFDHFPEFIANENFAARLQMLYVSHIKELEADSVYQKGLSKGQRLAASLVKRSRNPEKAISAYLVERLYCPVITTVLSADSAKALLDCGLPFVLTRKGKSFICLGYAKNAGEFLLLLGDNECVEQEEISRNELGLRRRKSPEQTRESRDPEKKAESQKGEDDINEKMRKFHAELDQQFGLLKRDCEFGISTNSIKGISFTTIVPGDTAVMICSLPPGDAEIREFIRKNQRNIDDIIKFIKENHNEEE